MSARRMPGPLCWLANGFRQHPEFQRFAQAANEAEAAQFIKRTCEIGSRSQLDTEPAAAQRFHERVRRPYASGGQA